MNIEEKISNRIKTLNTSNPFTENDIKIFDYTTDGSNIILSFTIGSQSSTGSNNLKDFLNPNRSKYGCKKIGDHFISLNRRMTPQKFRKKIEQTRPQDCYLFNYNNFHYKTDSNGKEWMYVDVTCKEDNVTSTMRWDAFAIQKQNPKNCIYSKRKKEFMTNQKMDVWETEANKKGFYTVNNKGVTKKTDKTEFIFKENNRTLVSSYYDILHGRTTGQVIWTKDNKLQLLIEDDLLHMSHHQLLELIAQNIYPAEFKKLVYSESDSQKRQDTIKELIDLYKDDKLSNEDVHKILDTKTKQEEEKYQEEHTQNNTSINKSHNIQDTDEDLLPNTTDNLITELTFYDKTLTTYGEKNKFLTGVEKEKIWDTVLTEDSKNSTHLIDTLIEKRKVSSKWLSYVIDEFFVEYEQVTSIIPDTEYRFKYTPSLMQKLMVYKMLTNGSYLNLSGTGAGKTNAALMASRAIGAKNTVIVCPNSVVDTWEKAIQAIYPSSLIVIYDNNLNLNYINNSKSAYIIINYDKFSSGALSTKDKMDEFIDIIKPQFLCIDEIQNAKARYDDASIRHCNLLYFRKHANEVYGDDFKVLCMTATPLINNLNEVKSILELATGKSFDEIGNRNTIENIHLAYKYLHLYGIRYVPDYNINVVNTEVKIDGKSLKDSLINLKNRDINTIEGLFVNYKMDAIKNDLTPGTIIYSTFIEKIVPKIEKKLKEFNISYGRYTGRETADERAYILNCFSKGDFNVLVASSPITTGVDGLQKFCNKIILISLPWTNAEYTQLVGRINRQGSVFNEVNIIFPHIDIKLDGGKIWSWDNKRRNIIIKKKTLSDAVVDGVFTYSANISKAKLLQGAIESLKNGEATNDFELIRNEISVSPKIDTTTKEFNESIINNFNRRGKVTNSNRLHKELTDKPEDWFEYHRARHESMKTWNEIPYEYIASKIKNKNRVVADFGCGENLMKNCIPNNKVYSFDHIAIDDSVIACDMAHTPLEDESIDIAVFSLALWGSNYEDYFEEAYRILNYDGLVYIAEPTKSYSEEERNVLVSQLKSNGFTQVGDIECRGKFFYLTLIKK